MLAGADIMPLYEYFCPKCAAKYELLRPIGRGEDPGTCPKGHGGGARTLSMFAAVTKGGSTTEMMGAPSGGGCGCGGASCGCGH
jgi:putative FmdB family regulatory protein